MTAKPDLPPASPSALPSGSSSERWENEGGSAAAGEHRPDAASGSPGGDQPEGEQTRADARAGVDERRRARTALEARDQELRRRAEEQSVDAAIRESIRLHGA